MTTQETPTSIRSVPTIIRTEAKSHEGRGHNIFMMACCAVMIAGFGIVIFTVPAGQTWPATLLSAFPLVACLGVHFIIARIMGRSCHGSDAAEPTNKETSK